MSAILITTSSFAKHSPALFGRLQEKGFEVIVNPFGRKLSEREVTELIKEHRPIGMIAGVEPLTRKVLEAATGLRVISRCGIGLDSVDLEAAADMGVMVTNTPDGPTVSVAELTLGLILSLLRMIPASDARIRREEWFRPMGGLLMGRTVGIIGCGRIGNCVAKLLTAFDCQVLGYDPMVQSSEYLELVSFDALLTSSDIVSLHLPYSKKTHHILDASRLRSLKQGALVVNASRGGLIDEQGLYECLNGGQIGGAALDCFEQEPYIGPLKKLDNVVLTGHIGSYAREGRALMEEQAVDNLVRELMKV